ncbi:hypothetical protein B9479_004279 [Cryptococcus floricola]|uniref:Uncharacterized protein n=1 Tax=Cryptococcus floricola TaxID=2591691 RepID=A0A5D3AUE6_9TREE|nr:hypothetical protein B9479_004279 [Cryptococcus floricola]
MRAFTLLVSLGLISSVLAAPAPQPGLSPLFSKDPLSLHRRSAAPDAEADSAILAYDPDAASSDDTLSSPSSSNSDSDIPIVATEPEMYEVEEAPAEDACADVCGVTRVEGAKSEKEALCSGPGLRATYTCAQCIDQTWPDNVWEDSAMAEYEKIASACDNSLQQPIRRGRASA